MEIAMTAPSNWTVADAKAQLSEILRLARQGKPQMIGTQNPCVVVSMEDYNARTSGGVHKGRWLVERASRLGFDIELPSRHEDRDDDIFAED
jgi:prevent-host-death family protein